ncbi:MAG: glycosyltransferase [Bacilli bacterium]|jgi:1,2-diacylglycerol 3-alpha-glucosyltransferase
MKQIRVALFTDTFLPEINGVATSTASLQTALKNRGHYCVVVTSNPFSNKVTFEDDVLRLPGIELKKLYGYHLASFYNRKAMKILESLNLDLVHIQTEATVGLFAKSVIRRLKLPYVYTYHTMYEDYTYYATKGHFDLLAKSIIKEWSRAKAEAANSFVSPSEKTKDAMREYGVNRYINVIPTGIDLARFRQENIDMDVVAELKKKYKIEDTLNLIYLGRIAEEKSIDVVIKGYANFLKTNRSTPSRLLIVGKGPQTLELKQLTSDLGINDNVIFVGPVPPSEVPIYYQLGDIFVSASISETQGLTFMEAMAADRLLLCCYDDNLKDVIIDGKTGFFFDNEQHFPTVLEKIIKLPKEEIDKILDEAFLVADEYSLERFGERMERVYIKTLRNNW